MLKLTNRAVATPTPDDSKIHAIGSHVIALDCPEYSGPRTVGVNTLWYRDAIWRYISAWRHQAITWTNVIFQRSSKLSFCMTSLKHKILLKLSPQILRYFELKARSLCHDFTPWLAMTWEIGVNLQESWYELTLACPRSLSDVSLRVSTIVIDWIVIRYFNTLRPEQKRSWFAYDFLNTFSWMIILYFDLNFSVVSSYASNWQHANITSDNGLSPFDTKPLSEPHNDRFTESYMRRQAPVPLTRFRSNSKFDQHFQCSGFKYTPPITAQFCTCHDSAMVSMSFLFKAVMSRERSMLSKE